MPPSISSKGNGKTSSRRVEMAEIEKNDFNLNISGYISTAQAEEEVDLAATQAEIESLTEKIEEARQRHNQFLRELGLMEIK